MNTKKSITFIGAGNVATHLAKAFFSKGFNISQIYSKSLTNAITLANKVNAVPIHNLSDLTDENHIYIVCLKDDVIEQVLNQITIKQKLIVHTSGSIDMNVFSKEGFENYGILYPLQTFSKDKDVNIDEVPFCIEANTTENENKLVGLAKSLANNVQLINSDQRKKLHLAAVFACNFSNYMYTIADELLVKNNLDLNLLKPLIIETANKIKDAKPALMQTGPAKRNDKAIIEKHIQLLADSKDYQDIYKLITENIFKNS